MKSPNFNPKQLAYAVAVGLTMLSSTAMASGGNAAANNAGNNAGTANSGTAGAAAPLVDLVSPNLDNKVEKFQTIGDLEIYQAAKEGKVTMTMMLDLSGSMWWCLGRNADGSEKNPDANNTRYGIENYKLTDKAGLPVNTITENGKTIDISQGINVVHAYCDNGAARNRLSELKHAVMSLFADGTKLPEDYKIGIGVFPIYGNRTSRIAVPAKELTVEHRYRILKEVAGFNAIGGTPSVMAIAEAGAYMMGTTTTAFKANAQRKTGFIATAVLDDESSVGGQSGYSIARQCSGNRNLWTYSGSGPVTNNLSLNAAQALQYVGGIDTFQGGVGTTKSVTVTGNDTWLSCGFASDNAIGDRRFMDFTKYGFDASNSPLRVFGNAIKRDKGLDLNYMGYFTDAYDVANKRHYTLIDNKLPNINLGSSGTATSLYQRKGVILLGNKIEFVEEVSNYPDSPSFPEHVANSGFSTSSVDTKKPDLRSYESPLEDSIKTCDGAGIFFLTDGEPNQALNYQHIMARSLKYPERSYSSILDRLKRDSGHKDDLMSDVVYDTVRNADGTYSQVINPNKGNAYINSGWNVLGAYAAILRKSSITGKPVIKTATLGFGPVFNKETVGNISRRDASTGKVVSVVDCAKYSTVDARNLCYLGEKTYGYGDGGFTATSNAGQVADSIIRFTDSLKQEISNQPAGTISVPKDPLSVSNIQPYAYLPMIAPEVAKSDALWKGNLKKYHTLNGTLYGKDGQTRLYRPATTDPEPTAENRDFPSQFNAGAQDIWQTETGDGTLITTGGTYSKIKDIGKGTDRISRSAYVENYINFRDNTPGTNTRKELVKVSISNGRLEGFDKLRTPYNTTDKAYLVNFLGVKVPVDATNIAKNDAELAAQVARAVRDRAFHDTLLGGVLHSVPVLATYRGEFDGNTGAITSNETLRQDHILYGSMDGALHLVKADTGAENFAFIPRAMFEDTQQRHAMLPNSTNNKVGQPKFGVDGPWVTHAEYVYDFSKTPAEVRAQKMQAFGGLRMGGNGIYGLDITDRDKPKLNFALTRWARDFERMGQIWAKPTLAKIKFGEGPSDVKDVVIFGGGYDICYEHPLFKLNDSNPLLQYDTSHVHREQIPDNTTTEPGTQKRTTLCTNKTQAQGNAVYMIDAEDGTLIARWQANNGTDDRRHMLHSVVGEIATLDSNNNGAIDHLYFADLGGQVFRVDLREIEDENEGFTNLTRRVVRVFNANGSAYATSNPKHINYRFYDKPLVTFHDHGDKSFAVVNVASGDRSSPVHTHRTPENSNRIYGFFDRDLTTDKLDRAGENLDKMLSRDINEDNLVEINTREVELKGAEEVNRVLKLLQDGVLSTKASENSTVRQGWFYPMTRFDGRINVSGLKSVGLGTVIGSVYYANIYSPSYEYTMASECSARVSGGTERQLYCLPWGICADSTDGNKPTTPNGVLGYLKAGPGIQELALGTVTNTPNKSGNFRTLLGHQTLSELGSMEGKRENRRPGGDSTSALTRLPNPQDVQAGAGTGADVYGQKILTAPRYTLSVQRWYDLQNEEQKNNTN